ncbi:MAG: PAS domain S-box protein [Desulfarculaceae bacterium]|nr:PAS domain S-box protein [Desulfarculaceae bacterium]MCF8071294.1 PAS domain S-box protein [Desulfarculaceae bacterium]MCF8101619.1 PAS domain S-box protein [Desulfarculaceae bacterium]MCF8117441.1 PAS domain S-box protein [Desulfarculaceae bacterium]
MHETYYLANLAFTIGYCLALIIYLGRHTPGNPKTSAFLRWLVCIIAWAFFDALISHAARLYPPLTVFELYRWFSFLFLMPTAFVGEVILALVRSVNWRDRLWIYGVPFAFYLTAIYKPDLISVRLYGVALGPSHFNPWFQAFLAYSFVFLLIMLLRLVRDMRHETDPDTRAEKRLLVVGGFVTMALQILAQWLMATRGPDFASLANLAVMPTALAVFWGARRYGRLVSPRTIYRTTVQAVPVGLAHLRQGRISWANTVMARLLGFTNAEAIMGRRSAELFRPFLARPRAAKHFLEELAEGRVEGEELTVRTDSGEQVPLLVSTSSLEGDDVSRGVLLVASDLSRLKSMQAKLQHSEARYRNLVEQATELIAVVQEGSLVFVNMAISGVLGWEPAEVVGQGPELFFHPDDIANLTDRYQGRVSNQTHAHILPCRVFTKQGDLKWMELASRVVDWEGRPALQVFFRDITERKLSEEERAARLSRVERQQAAIVQAAGMEPLVEGDFAEAARRITELCTEALGVERAGIWLFNHDRDRMVASDIYNAPARRHGWGEEMAAGMHPVFFASLEAERAVDAHDVYLDARTSELRFSYLEPNDVAALLAAAVRLRGRVMGMVCLERSSGPHGWREDELAFVGGMADQVAQALTNAERKKAQAALRESEERFRHLFDSISDLIYTHDDQGCLLSVNQAVVRTLGYSREELIGRTLGEFMRPEHRRIFMEQYLPTLRREGQAEGVALLAGKDGSGHYVEYRNLLVAKDGVPYVSGSGREITQRIQAERELKELQERLIQAQKMEAVGNLASGIAHDFNNILQGIGGYVELLGTVPAGDQSGKKYLGEVESAVGRAAELVRRLLTFGRKGQAELKPVDLNREVAQAVKILERTIPKMIKIETTLSEEAKVILGDATQLEQVLMNLATNARDAMPQGGRLQISTDNADLTEEFCRTHPGVEPGEYVLLRVQDNGLGMDRETVRHVFEPFYTTKGPGTGTGLGLFTVYGIVESHGGYINCDSTPGQGSEFTIYLPAASGGVILLEPEEDMDAPVTGGRETILLVDDEEAILEVVRDVLRQYGYAVLTADSGEGALEMFCDGPGQVDLVILDLGMPGMGGGNCLRRMLETESEAKIVVATGYAGSDKRGEMLEAGARRFITKPYRLDDLLRTVRQVLDQEPDQEPPAED